MINDNRRKIVKLLSVSGMGAAATPDKWIEPVVDSTTLPAHAETSVVCSGCFSHVSVSQSYLVSEESSPGFVTIQYFSTSSDCSGSPKDSFDLILATSEEEAQSIWEAENPPCGLTEIATNESSVCSLWECDA